MSTTLGIIGTAGRGDDGAKLTPTHWHVMKAVAQTVALLSGATKLVSGGAAISDHVAVALYLDGSVPALDLYLPAAFDAQTTCAFDKSQAGQRSQELHLQFESRLGVRSLSELGAAIRSGAAVTVNPAGFHARNAQVAEACDILLAFTFGDGPLLKDGGTKHTWDLFMARKLPCDEASARGCMGVRAFQAFHFDLNSKRLYRL